MTVDHEHTSTATRDYVGSVYMRVSKDIGRRIIAPLLRADSHALDRYQHGSDFYLQASAILHGTNKRDVESASNALDMTMNSMLQDNRYAARRAAIRGLSIDVLPRIGQDLREAPPDFHMIFYLGKEMEELTKSTLRAGGAEILPLAERGLLRFTANYRDFENPRGLAEARDSFNERLHTLGGAAVRTLYYAEPHKIHTSILERPLAKR